MSRFGAVRLVGDRSGSRGEARRYVFSQVESWHGKAVARCGMAVKVWRGKRCSG